MSEGKEFFLSDFVAQDLDLQHKGTYFYVDDTPMFFIIRASNINPGYYVRDLNEREVKRFGLAEKKEE